MRILFIGSVKFSLSMLEQLREMNADVVGVITKEFSSFNSDHVDLRPFCELNSVPWIYGDDINSLQISAWIRKLEPDVIFCFGWSQMIKREILEIPPLGVIGFHPSALPKNRGRHPLIWALVLGLTETASTFFRMNEGVDNGNIVSQVHIEIQMGDDASSLYEKVIRVAKTQLGDFVPKLASGTIKMQRQNESSANLWRKRQYSDGIIDWRMSSETIYNLVRGLSKPYVGAHFIHEGKEIKVWKTEIAGDFPINLEPGKILDITQAGPIVKCGVGTIRLIHTEPELKIVKGGYL